MSQFNERTVGRCLTEYKRKDFDQVVGNYEQFVMISQFDGTPKHIDEVDLNKSFLGPKLVTEPKCHTGNILFGVEKDGSLTELMSLIDSSD